MTLAYVISAYMLPSQVVRLVERLQGPDRLIFIHVDRKSAPGVFDDIAAGVRGIRDVEFLPRHDCHWGDFGHVRATLAGLDALAGRRFDYVALMTGQDYPIKSPPRVESRLAAKPDSSWMNHRPLPIAGLEDEGYGRLPTRTLPYGLRPYFGSGYWTLHHHAVEYVRRFVETHPAYVTYFERVHVPDEMFFQTILLNSPLARTIVDDDLRFIKWPGPAILTGAAFDELKSAPDLWARKFDERVDSAVLDRIDRDLLGC